MISPIHMDQNVFLSRITHLIKLCILGLSLEQILKTCALYEKKDITKRSRGTLRNIVSGYAGQENVEDDLTLQVLGTVQLNKIGQH